MDALVTNINMWWTLAAIVLLFIIAFELGFYIGRRRQKKINAASKTWISTAEIAILSMLGLLLAFTFVMVQTRFDLRQSLVIKEANAIGATYLRASLLPEPQKSTIQNLLRQYTNQRLNFIKNNNRSLRAITAQAGQIQKQLWLQTLSTNIDKIQPKMFTILVDSLNEMISLHTDRTAALINRVPALVLLILLLCSILAIHVIGYNCGLRNQRNFVPAAMLLLLVLVFLMILDLDSPNQGLIKVNQQSMIMLQKNLNSVK